MYVYVYVILIVDKSLLGETRRPTLNYILFDRSWSDLSNDDKIYREKSGQGGLIDLMPEIMEAKICFVEYICMLYSL